VMANHFHPLVRVPDKEILKRSEGEVESGVEANLSLWYRRVM
jgi:hypothetical protein